MAPSVAGAEPRAVVAPPHRDLSGWSRRAFARTVAVSALAMVTGCGSSDAVSSGAAPNGGAAGAVGSGGSLPGGAGQDAGGGTTPGGSGGGATGTGGASTTDAGCSAFAEAYCAQQLACRPTAFRAFWYTSLADCVSSESRVCTMELAAPGTSASPTTLAACAQAMSKQTCADFLTAAAPECLVPGALPNGVGCEFSSQCESSLCDVGTNVCGKCAPRVGAGGACIERGDLRFLTCQAGEVCSNSRCYETVPLGGACDRQIGNCAPPLVCFNGQCAAPVPLGGACNDARQCAGDAFCDFVNPPSPGVCTAFTYQPAGAACTETGPNICSAGFSCKAPDGSFTNDGTCAARGASGRACTLSDDCLAYCINGTCQDRPPASACP